MAEPAENLQPEPQAPEPESESEVANAAAGAADEPADIPNVEVGTFLQFGGREYRNVTIAGIDPVTKRVLAFRRNGDAVERILIPRDAYQSALTQQKIYDKKRGIKQKAAMGKFVGGLMNRTITHDGERATVAGYDAKRNEALLIVDNQPRWVSTPALLQSQKNIGVVREIPSATPAPKPNQLPTVRPVGVTVDTAPAAPAPPPSAAPTSRPSMIRQTADEEGTEESAEPEVIVQELTPLEAAALEQEAAQAESEQSVARQVQTQAARPSQPPIRDIREVRKAIREEKARRRAQTASSANWSTLSKEEKLSYLKDAEVTLRGERERLLSVEATITQKSNPSASEQRTLTEVRRQLQEVEVQIRLQQQASDSVSRNAPLDVTDLPETILETFPGTVAVGVSVAASAPAALGSQAAVIAQARTVVDALSSQISQRENQSNGLRAQTAALADAINALDKQASALPAGSPERAQIEVRIKDTSDQRRGLQDQMTSLAVQNNEDKRGLESIRALLSNIEQAPPEQAPPQLIQKLQDRIPKGTPLTPVIPSDQRESRNPLEAISPQATPTIPPPRIPLSQISRSPLQQQSSRISSAPTPAPQRSRTGAVRPIRALPNLPTPDLETQRAVGLISAQQADAYEQAFSGEGGIGGELSPLELGMSQPVTETYVAGAPEEEEPEDTFMLREDEGRRRMAERNKPQPLTSQGGGAQVGQAPVQLTPGQAPLPAAGQRAPSGAPAAPVAAPTQSSIVQRLLSAQNQAFLQQEKTRAAQTAAGAAAAVDANLQSIKKLKRLYDIAKLGSAATMWGIVITILTMNIQTINKYTVKIRIIPNPTLVEDFAVFAIDGIFAGLVLILLFVLVLGMYMAAIAFTATQDILNDPSGFIDFIRTASGLSS